MLNLPPFMIFYFISATVLILLETFIFGFLKTKNEKLFDKLDNTVPIPMILAITMFYPIFLPILLVILPFVGFYILGKYVGVKLSEPKKVKPTQVRMNLEIETEIMSTGYRTKPKGILIPLTRLQKLKRFFTEPKTNNFGPG